MANQDTITVEIPSGLVLKHGGWELDTASASPETLAYLLQNGFNQSMVDSAALGKDEKEGLSDDELKAMVADKKQKRYDNIVAGTVGTRVGGPRPVGIDKIINDIAIERVRAILVEQKGLKWPSGKGAAEKVAGFVAKYMENAERAESVRAEAERRMADNAAAKDAVDIDFAA
jgi:hypothetical protein